MLPVKTIAPYTTAGLFGARRKHDTHTGIDLYCAPHSTVTCIADGTVKEVIDFTGTKVGSPWWRDTQAVVVELPSGTIHVYGEILSAVEPQKRLAKGQFIGLAERVLIKDKTVNPPCMLHFEIWETNYQSNYTWPLDQPKPEGLQNPLGLFNFWVFKTPHGYCIDTYAGHYWKFFASAIDCKSYCMSRTEEFGEYYVYVNSAVKAKEYEACTGKRYVLPSNRSTAKNL
jgi:hypothetical protein